MRSSAHALRARLGKLGKRPGRDQETLRLTGDRAEAVRRAAAAGPASLLVYHRDGLEVVALAEGRPLTIGREEPADLVLDDPSLSRQHARFVLEGGRLRVDDLGSTNGLELGGERVETASLLPGEPIALGAVVASLHVRPRVAAAMPGLESHDRLRAALDREIVSARYFGEELGLAMVRAPDGAHLSSWAPRLEPFLRPVDRRGVFSDGVMEVVLPRMNGTQLGELAAQIAGASLRCAVATFPRAATSGEELLEVCLAALRRADDDTPVATAPSKASIAIEARAHAPVVASDAMRELFDLVDRLASSAISILIVGETGVGKEVVARAIHERGPRSRGPMLCVNCGAIVPQLVESTLFGHERGAFTGASRTSDGVFGAASGGTVLLDEIGELPPPAQAALLRVLETKRVTRVGATAEREVDVRVIAATHRDLEAMCNEGSFRRDLFYRLNAMVVEVPPLRMRREEIAPLAQRFLTEAQGVDGRRLASIAPDAMELLRRYDWPGNLRELKNVIERAVVIARGDEIAIDDLPQVLRSGRRSAVGEEDLKSRVRRHERELIEMALAATGGNQTEAARELGVPLRTFVHKLKTLGIRR